MKSISTILLAVTLVFTVSTSKAQTDTTKKAEPKKSNWTRSWVASLNGSQAEYSNWSQGGVSSVAGTASTVFDATYKNKYFGYTTHLNLKFGQTRIEWKEVRKTDDLIRFTNKFDYYLPIKTVSAYTEVDFRTQFDRGFNKDDILISNFFAPAFFQETAGLSYKPNSIVTSQIGLSMKQTIVSDTTLSNFYGVKPGEQFRGEGGLSFVLGVKTPMFANLSYTGTFETFTNFLTPLNWTDYTFANEFTGKINGKLSTVIQLILMYDRDFNNKVQYKQVISLGLNFKLI